MLVIRDSLRFSKSSALQAMYFSKKIGNWQLIKLLPNFDYVLRRLSLVFSYYKYFKTKCYF
jgi:hypothetical protein